MLFSKRQQQSGVQKVYRLNSSSGRMTTLLVRQHLALFAHVSRSVSQLDPAGIESDAAHMHRRLVNPPRRQIIGWEVLRAERGAIPPCPSGRRLTVDVIAPGITNAGHHATCDRSPRTSATPRGSRRLRETRSGFGRRAKCRARAWCRSKYE